MSGGLWPIHVEVIPADASGMGQTYAPSGAYLRGYADAWAGSIRPSIKKVGDDEREYSDGYADAKRDILASERSWKR